MSILRNRDARRRGQPRRRPAPDAQVEALLEQRGPLTLTQILDAGLDAVGVAVLVHRRQLFFGRHPVVVEGKP